MNFLDIFCFGYMSRVSLEKTPFPLPYMCLVSVQITSRNEPLNMPPRLIPIELKHWAWIAPALIVMHWRWLWLSLWGRRRGRRTISVPLATYQTSYTGPLASSSLFVSLFPSVSSADDGPRLKGHLCQRTAGIYLRRLCIHVETEPPPVSIRLLRVQQLQRILPHNQSPILIRNSGWNLAQWFDSLPPLDSSDKPNFVRVKEGWVVSQMSLNLANRGDGWSWVFLMENFTKPYIDGSIVKFPQKRKSREIYSSPIATAYPSNLNETSFTIKLFSLPIINIY